MSTFAKRYRVLIPVVLMLLVLSVTLVGCGGKTNSTGQESNQGQQSGIPATDSANGSKEPIKIGAVPDLSGPTMSTASAFYGGFSTYLKYINDQGGVNGRKIELVTEDGKYDMQREKSMYEKLRQEGVLTVGITWSTGIQKALVEVYPRDKNVVFPGSRAAFLVKPQVNPYVFLTSPTYDVGYNAQVDYVAKLKPGAKVILVRPDNSAGQDASKWYHARADAKGIKITDVILNFDAVDGTTQAIQVKSANPDFVFVFASGRPTKTWLDAAQKVGVTTPQIVNYNTTEQFLITVGKGMPILKNITGIAFYAAPAEDVPGLKKMVEVAKQYQVKPDTYMAQWFEMGWTDAMVMVEGLKRCGDNVSGEKLKEAIETIKDFDTGGLTAPLTFSPTQHSAPNKVKYVKVNADKGVWEPIGDWATIDN